MGRLEPALVAVPKREPRGEKGREGVRREGGKVRRGGSSPRSWQCQRENPRGEKGREGVRREGGKVRTAVTIVPAFWGERAGQK